MSPCILVCSLDEEGCCRGCYRTGAEIAQWMSLDAAGQWAVIRAAEARRLRAAARRSAGAKRG